MVPSSFGVSDTKSANVADACFCGAIRWYFLSWFGFLQKLFANLKGFCKKAEPSTSSVADERVWIESK